MRDASLVGVHLFDSRRAAFREDSVLQENLILHLLKTTSRPEAVKLSWSSCQDGPEESRAVSYEKVVQRRGGDLFLHLPTEESEDFLAEWMAKMPCQLSELGLQVSTGRVVDFRAREWLRADAEEGCAPLIYPCHFEQGLVRWPKTPSRKPNAIFDSGETRSLLVPSGHYVLVRRLSSKEEPKRVVPARLEPSAVPGDWIGLENHVNHFHADGMGLERDLADGLAAYLASTAVDLYFRQFSGHTQVNATDLRSIRYPSRENLKRLGKRYRMLESPSQEAVDHLLNEVLPLNPIPAVA